MTCHVPLVTRSRCSSGSPPQVCEKEKLLSERNQLKVCMSELWQNLSYLSQQVRREVQDAQQPPPLAPPTSSSADVSASIDLTSCPPSPASSSSSFTSDNEALSQSRSRSGSKPGSGSGSGPGSSTGRRSTGAGQQGADRQRSPAVTVDFCQEMTEKCTTTEEQQQKGRETNS